MEVSHGKVFDLAFDAVLYLYLTHQLISLQDNLLRHWMIQGYP